MPGEPSGAYLAAALATTLLFFGSLLAHEMAHALLARRLGIEIEGITLWLFGGMAKFRADAAGPGAELRIAAVGPAVSLGLAVLFLALAAALAAVAAPGLAVAAASWLGLINACWPGSTSFPPSRWTAAACCAPCSGCAGSSSPGRLSPQPGRAPSWPTC